MSDQSPSHRHAHVWRAHGFLGRSGSALCHRQPVRIPIGRLRQKSATGQGRAWQILELGDRVPQRKQGPGRRILLLRLHDAPNTSSGSRHRVSSRPERFCTSRCSLSRRDIYPDNRKRQNVPKTQFGQFISESQERQMLSPHRQVG